MTLLDLLAASPALLMICTGLLGLMVGSFLNVVIYRLPRMMERDWQQEARHILELPTPADATPAARFNLLVPGSRCGACGAAIKPWHNLPVFGWLWLRGKAACCGARISPRYPLVEALVAAVSVLCAWRFGCTAQLIAALALSWTLVALLFIDLDTMLLPDQLTLPLLWAGLLFNLCGWGFAGLSLQDAVIGAMVGYLSLWLVYWAFKLATGKDGMGFGDFKLLAAIGAWLGWLALPQVILLSSLVGSLVGVSMMLFKGLKRDQPIPFGPYLAAAGWLALMGIDVLKVVSAALAAMLGP